MNVKILSLVGVFLLSNSLVLFSQEPQNGTGETDGYKLVWQDLFDSNTLDETDRWSIEVNGDGGGNSELQYYRRENISIGTEPVSGSHCLVITAKKENFGGKTATSGRLTTQRNMSFKHGKVEARIKVPHTANGLWPAFWLLGNTVTSEGWPRCGEIDIMEMGNATGIRNNTQDRYFNGACHWGYYENGGYPNYAKASTNAYGLQDDFHLFTMTWDENMIQMYLDKDKYPDVQPYYAMDISSLADDRAPGNYLHRQFFVIFNMAVGGNFTGIWDINKITALADGEAKMYVDYVKVYQKGTADEEFFGSKTTTSIIAAEGQSEIQLNITEKKLNVTGDVKRISLLSQNGMMLADKYNVKEMNLSGFCSGCYLVRMEMSDGRCVMRKICLR